MIALRSRTSRCSGPRLVSLAVMLALAGCARLQTIGIVDQRTFDHAAGVPPKVHLPVVPGKPGPYSGPLITIDAGTPAEQWQGPLKQAVQAAMARKPNVLFELRQSVPAGSDVDASAAAAQAAAKALLGPVAQAIVDDGAAIAQVQVSAATQAMPPGSRGGVQIYLH